MILRMLLRWVVALAAPRPAQRRSHPHSIERNAVSDPRIVRPARHAAPEEETVPEILEAAWRSLIPTLGPADGCDRCIQQARVRLVSPGEDVLDLCRHHYQKHELALLSGGWRLHSDTLAELTLGPKEATA